MPQDNADGCQLLEYNQVIHPISGHGVRVNGEVKGHVRRLVRRHRQKHIPPKVLTGGVLQLHRLAGQLVRRKLGQYLKSRLLINSFTGAVKAAICDVVFKGYRLPVIHGPDCV